MRRALLVVLVAALIAAAGLPAFAWKFASMADSRGDNNGVNVDVLTKIVGQINKENVDLVLFQGDAVNGGCDDTCLSSQMDTWLGVMKSLNCPWYYTCGNHEVSRATSEDVLRNKLNQPMNGPADNKELVYSFNHKDAHFVVLNSEHIGQFHHVQESWLAQDLSKNTKPHVFVMAHDPAYPAGPHNNDSLDKYKTERDGTWNTMSGAGVEMYLCGHEHLYSRKQSGNIYQVINGSCGAPFHTGIPDTIAKSHYVVVSIDGNNIHSEAKDEQGKVFDSWDYVLAPTCDSLRSIKNGKMVILRDKKITYSTKGAVYVSDDNGSFTVRIPVKTGLPINSRISIMGTLQSLPGGEREINGEPVVVAGFRCPLSGPCAQAR